MRAIIFANGVIPELKNVSQLISDTDFIVSADGGLRYIRALDLTPELIVGDLDSVSPEDLQFVKEKNIEIARLTR